jgi:hypothetical protein
MSDKIDCNERCKNELKILNDLIKNKGTHDEIQNATTDHLSCMNGCEDRNRHRAGGGNRKKYINKTKNRRSSTRRRVRHRRPRTHMNHRKKIDIPH